MRRRKENLNSTGKNKAKREHMRHWGNECAYCDRRLELENMTLDHFLPLKRGGPKGTLNTLLACEECNYCKGKIHPARYILSLKSKISAQQRIADIMTYFNFRYYFHVFIQNHSKENRERIQVWYDSLWSWMNQFTTVRRIDNAI